MHYALRVVTVLKLQQRMFKNLLLVSLTTRHDDDGAPLLRFIPGNQHMNISIYVLVTPTTTSGSLNVSKSF